MDPERAGDVERMNGGVEGPLHEPALCVRSEQRGGLVLHIA
jgi:hypothetical protein